MLWQRLERLNPRVGNKSLRQQTPGSDIGADIVHHVDSHLAGKFHQFQRVDMPEAEAAACVPLSAASLLRFTDSMARRSQSNLGLYRSSNLMGRLRSRNARQSAQCFARR